MQESPSTLPAIRSMLRTRTETGDVGQSYTRYPRIYSPAFSRRYQPWNSPQTNPRAPLRPLAPNYSPRRTIASDKYFRSLHDRMTSPRSGPRSDVSMSREASAVGDYRSFSMTQSSYLNHSLINRSPYDLSTQHSSRGTLHKSRPRSPFAYPTRLKRPGHRPISPAYSDPSRSLPGSRKSGRSPYHNSSSFVSDVDRTLSHPGRRPSQAERTFSLAASPNPPPLFYDYSENFEEGPHVVSISIAHHTYINPPENGHPDSVEGDQCPEVSFVADLPSDVRIHSQNLRNGVLESCCPPNDWELLKHENGASASKVASKSCDQDAVLADTKGDADLLVRDSHAPGPQKIRPQDVPQPQQGSEENLSSSADSMYSAESSTVPDCVSGLADSADALTSRLVKAKKEGSSFQERVRDTVEMPTVVILDDSLLTRTTSVRSLSSDIIAPTPERSRTSVNARRRFSKILSIDEGLAELDQVASSSHQLRTTRSSKSSRPETDEPSKEMESAAKTDRPMISEDYDSEYDQDLSKGFRDTFCRPRQTSPEVIGQGYAPLATPEAVESTQRGASANGRPIDQTSTPASVRSSHRKISIISGLTWPLSHTEASRSEPTPSLTMLDGGIPLPSLQEDGFSLRSFAPPSSFKKTDLPFDFTPLIQERSEEMLASGSSEREVTSVSFMQDKVKEEDSSSCSSKEDKNMSTPGSRPWNLDESYPWIEETPHLDVLMPLSEEGVSPLTEKVPKFRLRIHRASSSTGRTKRLTKTLRSSEDTTLSLLDYSVDLSCPTISSSKIKKALSAPPGQSNSSHDMTRSGSLQTRFVDSFQPQSQLSPKLTLMPPSPGYEVRSFFSDDSSQVRPKNSLRNRLSAFRTRHNRVHSASDRAGYDRGLLSSGFGVPKSSGRSSRQSQNTLGTASQGTMGPSRKWRLFKKMKVLIKSPENKFREWRRHRRQKAHADQESAPELYVGV